MSLIMPVAFGLLALHFVLRAVLSVEAKAT
jgi:hypothetical protein